MLVPHVNRCMELLRNEKYRQPSKGGVMDTAGFCTVFGMAGTTDHDRFRTIDQWIRSTVEINLEFFSGGKKFS